MESSNAIDRMDIVLEDEDITRVVLVSVVGAYRQLCIFSWRVRAGFIRRSITLNGPL